jgi:Cdc6-like AAA superfamily ATPase
MDISGIVLYAILSAILSAVLPSVRPTLAAIFTYKRNVTGNEQVRRIDRTVMRAGWTSSTTVESDQERPGSGWHLIAQNGIASLVLAIRSQSADANGARAPKYNMYSFQLRALQNLAEISRSANTVTVMQYERLMAFRSTSKRSQMEPPGAHPRASQQKAVKAILAHSKPKGAITVLLCGAPGSGKSVCAQYLAIEMMKDGTTAPTVIQGVDLTAKCMSLMALLPQIIEKQMPHILVLDEIDTAFKHATEPRVEKGEQRCLAETKTSLCNELDRLSRIPNLIVIGTTNIPHSELCLLYPAFTREGRFDLQIPFDSEKSE